MVVDLNRLGVDFLLVNSTNEFLAEYSALTENSRYVLTGFSGSTGDALIAKTGQIYLFVDGRYHTQAEQEIHENIKLIKLQTGQKQDEEIMKLIPAGAVLGVVGDKLSMARFDGFKGVKLEVLELDPINVFTEINTDKIEFLSASLCGKSFEEKIAGLPKPFFVSCLEEVSYLLNARDFSKNYASKIQGKLLLTEYEKVLFTDMVLENCPIENLVIMPLDKTREILGMIDYPVYVDRSEISVSDYKSLRFPASIDSPIKKMKSIKSPEEIEGYKKAFAATDRAICATREFIMNSDKVSEFDIASELEKNFRKFGAKSLSFKSIVAKDKNSALAHYSKNSKEEYVCDGSLVLIDCGAYFENGLATDITRVFVKGEPTPEMRKIYTTVLKMFLNAFNTPLVAGLSGFDVDMTARNLIKDNPIEGYSFGHGLGHGIGINVHEAPPNLSPAVMAKIPFEEGMCFTIEPGLYNPETFGVRLENSCYFEDGKIKSFVNAPYEEKLIDFSMLNDNETRWLKEFKLI